MYDFWYSVGAAIINPGLLDEIGNHAAFTFVKSRIIQDVELDGTPADPRVCISAGTLSQKPVREVRSAISRFLRRHHGEDAPVVSLYCAGRFSQLIRIQRFSANPVFCSSFAAIVERLNAAYLRAAEEGAPKTNRHFPAFLGVCAMDGQVVAGLQGKPADAKEFAEVLANFEIAPESDAFQFAAEIVSDPHFTLGAHLLFFGDFNPWAAGGVTLEQITWWEGRSEYAVP